MWGINKNSGFTKNKKCCNKPLLVWCLMHEELSTKKQYFQQLWNLWYPLFYCICSKTLQEILNSFHVSAKINFIWDIIASTHTFCFFFRYLSHFIIFLEFLILLCLLQNILYSFLLIHPTIFTESEYMACDVQFHCRPAWRVLSI